MSDRKPTFVVAERDMVLRRNFVEMLEDMGAGRVLATQSGTTAWTLLKRHGADFVVSGLQLAEISGLTLLKIVRADEDFLRIPFLLVAEVVTKAEVVEAGECGVSEILCRPITRERLREKVMALLNPEPDERLEEGRRLFQRGMAFMEAKRWQDALVVFKRVLASYENPEVYYNLGYIHTVLERYEEAISFFRKATEIDATFAAAFQRMGECFLAIGDDRQAEEHLTRAASISLERERFEESREQVMEEVARVNPDTINIFNTLGIIYRRRGQYAEAARQYQKALRVNPEDENIYYNLGRCLNEAGDLDRAQKALAKALELRPGFAEASELSENIRRKVAAGASGGGQA